MSHIEPQKEAGLIIAEDSASLIETEKILQGGGFKEGKTALAVLDHLKSGSSTYAVLRSPLSKDLYDVIVQYTDRGGMIQLMDKSTMDLRSVQFDPTISHLVLLVLRENLIDLEKAFPLREKVGLTEQI